MCRPPGNRNPQPDEMAQCEPYLLRQIELVRPRLILAMGRCAAAGRLPGDDPDRRVIPSHRQLPGCHGAWSQPVFAIEPVARRSHNDSSAHGFNVGALASL